jgi:hypothetical protein
VHSTSPGRCAPGSVFADPRHRAIVCIQRDPVAIAIAPGSVFVDPLETTVRNFTQDPPFVFMTGLLDDIFLREEF